MYPVSGFVVKLYMSDTVIFCASSSYHWYISCLLPILVLLQLCHYHGFNFLSVIRQMMETITESDILIACQ